ncbi:ATP-dependent zinc protease family protein [Tuwongella immobilis]|uniref:Retropepsin-like aspartic endopeptidase domain-containing protein n=1 Tax=Tuwongella immobilis TaxID=692036 RepID=A0A6C2YHV7_9BACT|nr:RimK/LysX family protein [Tuwongella immobilis]VIP01007.1 Uncharacterized protein OS=Planctomyces brasiliensis (strain ATCC 49424 / DSM 5305 / JCM 21570 / NBRC 103401 / IFAM 1448) GN=Plabr_4681 PE=4 SV=1: Zn_protease [Tuwongella immobilis]VTR97438.1 Uncharacterized protein OS=Planctomyces brasiliensis (strain ATCC 49424 / DSM 5305 / JCM 21570 / NBRC 103401 / IFAM 1448) GN=Plabr_4681 PE=4 SV=1: Zn_protease [Tuwongella immobilis]
MSESPITIGWKERIDLPEWGFRRVRAKMDTGAYTTAMGVRNVQIRQRRGETVVSFFPAIRSGRIHTPRRIIAPLVGMVRVRSSNGHVEDRPVIETIMRLGTIEKRIRITLTDRSQMRTGIILGRRALCGDFVVDVGQKYRLAQPS